MKAGLEQRPRDWRLSAKTRQSRTPVELLELLHDAVGTQLFARLPAPSAGCPPAAGRARASERVTCAEPPRGKKKSAETTSRPTALAMVLSA